jgi:hypothetical protein
MYYVEGEETRRGLSLLKKYKQRPPGDEDVTYIAFLKRYNHHTPYSLRPTAKERVLTYFPWYLLEDTENFSRAKLVLHYPFRKVEDLLYLANIHNYAYLTYTKAYAKC